MLVLLVLAPLAAFVPLSALSGILFVVAYNMSELDRVARTIRRAPRADTAVMLITLGLTVATDVVIAVEAGVVLAMVVFLKKMADSVAVNQDSALPVGHDALPEGVLLFSIDGPFFFGAIEQFEHALAATHTEPDTLVIDLSRVPFVDLSGLLALRDAIHHMRKRHIRVLLCGANVHVAERVERALGEDIEFAASTSVSRALEHAAA